MKLFVSNGNKERLRGGRLAGSIAVVLLLTGSPALTAGSRAQDEVTRNFDKTLTLGAGQSVRVEHKFGEVKVHGESGREVKISAVIRAQASSHEEAESFAQKIQIEVQQTSEGIGIRTIYPPEENRWFHISKHSSWSVSYDIAVPTDTPLNIRNSFGSVSVARVHGAVDVENGYGSLTVQEAGPVRLNNSFGSIELTGATGSAAGAGNVAGVRCVLVDRECVPLDHGTRQIEL